MLRIGDKVLIKKKSKHLNNLRRNLTGVITKRYTYKNTIYYEVFVVGSYFEDRDPRIFRFLTEEDLYCFQKKYFCIWSMFVILDLYINFKHYEF